MYFRYYNRKVSCIPGGSVGIGSHPYLRLSMVSLSDKNISHANSITGRQTDIYICLSV